MGLMGMRYNICMKPNNDIWMVVIRKVGHLALQAAPYEPKENKNQWSNIGNM